jgi:hypothetical protein
MFLGIENRIFFVRKKPLNEDGLNRFAFEIFQIWQSVKTRLQEKIFQKGSDPLKIRPHYPKG